MSVFDATAKGRCSFRKTGLTVACFLSLAASSANAQKTVKRCAGIEVLSIHASRETGKDWPLSTGAEIRVLPVSGTPKNSGEASTIVVYGAVLAWPQDSQEVKTKLECTAKGLRLEMTIVHITDGSVLKSTLWRPKIELKIFIQQPEVVLESIWKMRWNDGKSMDHAQTPPYPEQKYPITVTKTLHGRKS